MRCAEPVLDSLSRGRDDEMESGDGRCFPVGRALLEEERVVREPVPRSSESEITAQTEDTSLSARSRRHTAVCGEQPASLDEAGISERVRCAL